MSRELAVGIGAASLGFFLKLSTYSVTSGANGVAQCSYTDISPLILGPVAAIAGILAIVRCRRPGRKIVLELGFGVLCVLVCGVHILRGLGIVGGYCN